MKVNTLTLVDSSLPEQVWHIEPPPKKLYWAGARPSEILNRPGVAIVGSRKATLYGRTVAQDISLKLASSGVVIISGLAFGIDSYAHEAALKASGLTIAVLPSPLNKIYPASHQNLAERILSNGGALVSEYPPGTEVQNHHFIARNRLISALADAVVIPEAARSSGSLHTANFALEQGKTVMAVPGNISSPTSEGCNNLIKSGAAPVTSADDIFFALGINPVVTARKIFQGTRQQQLILELIAQGVQSQEILVESSKMNGAEFSSTLTSLELKGYIRPSGSGNWNLA